MKIKNLRIRKKFLLGAILTFLLAIDSKAQEQGIIINEFSNGSSGAKEYIEFLVVGCSGSTVDIRGWLFDDNNGDFSGGPIGSAGIAPGHSRFSLDAQWATVPVGSLILVYNSGDKNISVTLPDDPSDSNVDSVYILSHSNSTLIETCNTTPTTGNATYNTCTVFSPGVWTCIGMRNQGDATQVRKPDGSYFHGFGFGDATSNNTGGPDNLFFSGSGASQVYSYTSSSCNYRDITNFSAQSVSVGETPGMPNNASNLDYIKFLREGIFLGNISSNQTICTGTTPTTLIESGSIIRCYVNYQWQSSLDGMAGTFTSIVGATSISYSPSALSATTYYRRIVNNICIDDTSNIVTISVTQPPTKPDPPVTASDTLCVNPMSSTFSTNPIPGATGYVWEIYPSSAGVIIGSSTSVSIDWDDTYIGAVKVTVKATDCGASPASDTTTIAIFGTTVQAGLDQLFICGDTTYLSASAGTGSWAILSGNGGYLSDATIYNTAFFSVVLGEMYILEWTSSMVCSVGATDQVQIQFNSIPLPPTVQDSARCGSGIFTLFANGGTNGDYRWYDVNSIPITNGFNDSYTTPFLTNSTDYLVSIINGTCESSKVLVKAIIYNQAVADAGLDQNTIGGIGVNLNGSGNGTFLWNPATTLSQNNIANPLASPNVTTTYFLTVTTVNGCFATDSVTVIILCDEVFIPNLITPNEDGKNDRFDIGCTQSLSWNIEISNRWGDTVYRNSNYNNEWNAEGLSDGIYFYYLKSDILKVSYKGWIQVLN